MASATILITSVTPPTRHKIEPGASKTQCGKYINILNSEKDSKQDANTCQKCFTNGR